MNDIELWSQTHHLRAAGEKPGGWGLSREVANIRDAYDFSAAKRNPYAKRLKQQVTIRLDADSVDYFKSLAEEMGIPCQTLINL